MATPQEKFKKLLAAYEDEVQRKQHKMGKKIDPRDVIQPDWTTGYATFMRGTQPIWGPSFEEIGLFSPSSRAWLWGWADPGIDIKVKTRMDEVRKQGIAWGIDMLSTDSLTLETEQQAWELATVATAVSRADAMYRIVEPEVTRFLALFEGPPTSRSSMSMRAIRPETGSVPPGRMPSGQMPALRQTGSSPVITGNNPVIRPSSVPSADREPTGATRAEIGQRLFEAVPYAQQSLVGVVSLVARAIPPSGPVGAVGLELRIVLKPSNGGPDVTLQPTAALHDALVSLWVRCRDRYGAAWKFASGRIEQGPQGYSTAFDLEW
ncbi:MAG: DUF6882 domain-containing protein [Polyangiales bacterium]